MIISHKHKYIFIKTRKTAGTSIEVSLSRYCGPGDIITKIFPEDERVRKELGVLPQNHCSPLWDYGLRDFARLLVRRRRKLKYRNHIAASKIRSMIGEEIWNSYFKFCFERNPWDKMISAYYFYNRKNEFIDLDEYLRRGGFKPNFNLYTIDNQLAVDFVGRYETLEADLQQVCDRLGIAYDGWLPRTKSNFRKDRRPYQEVLSQVQGTEIERMFAQEIELMGYKF